MVDEVTSLKKDFNQKENKFLEEFLDLKALKDRVEDKLFKQGQSIQTVHMMCKPRSFYDEVNKVAIGYKNPLCLHRARQVQPALYSGHVNITPPNYSKENFLATFSPQKQLTPEQLFWSQDIVKMKAEALKEQNTRPIKALTVTFEGIQKAYQKKLKKMSTAFDSLEAEQTKSVYVASNFLDSCSRFTKCKRLIMLSKPVVLGTEVELSILRDDVRKDNYTTIFKPVFHLRNNREVHLVYLRHLKESVDTLRDIVEEAKVERPLDRSLEFACRYTKHSQELLEYVFGTCPKVFNQQDKKHATTPRKKQVTFEDQIATSSSTTHIHVEPRYTQKSNVPVPPSTGVSSCTNASGSQPRSILKKHRIPPAKSDSLKKVEDHSRTIRSSLRTTNRVDSSISSKRTVVQIVLGMLHQGCSKHMTGDRSRLMNFVKKFIGTVRFGNDHFGAIMGYGDYVIGESVISRVYYVEGLGHNLFSVGQFCDSDLEVAFRKHSCYVRVLIRDTERTRWKDMLKSSPICLLSKASRNKSWLWHRRLNHLNFGTINDLARKDLVRGLPRLKFEKDHLCSACQLGKSKKHTHKPKTENTNLEVLNTLHMDLCGPMRVQTINGKKYILVIVDDISLLRGLSF
ncbi:retrovirus-related pol polyprotein from transposon TNT 1-94 [Tanacetum coccineum]